MRNESGTVTHSRPAVARYEPMRTSKVEVSKSINPDVGVRSLRCVGSPTTISLVDLQFWPAHPANPARGSRSPVGDVRQLNR